MPEGSETAAEQVDASATQARSGSASPLLAGVGAVVLAVLLVVCVYAGSVALAAAYLLSALVVAVGWPMLLGLQRERSSALVLGIGAVSMAIIVGWADTADGIRWVTAALAISLALVFLQSLVSRGERERVVISLAVMSLGLGALASGAFLADAALRVHGREAVVAALAGAALGTALDAVLHGRGRLSEATLPVSLLLGIGAGLIAAGIAGVPWNAPLVAGLLGAAVSHAFRTILRGPARTGGPQAQLALGAATVLFVGVLPTAAVWIFSRIS
ncbi:hypothetical protein [Allobranchiibius sp. CTAmp26]|uniref:hypothetical protein n=1 Tax=Allobranchiibius sp. CTAmp26 TaxID=2815214 RepID=UPI001AA1C0CE|nr:hypothetical protein [Allobranchiibius sp. CTAmp26]MBO1753819.1 hypothetical protein [Allobranchiibius sp. CTAmp26]